MENIAKLFGLKTWACANKHGYVWRKNHIPLEELNFNNAKDALILLEKLKNNEVVYNDVLVERRFFSIRPYELILTFTQQIDKKHVEFHSVVYLKEENNSIQNAIISGISDIATQIINYHNKLKK